MASAPPAAPSRTESKSQFAAGTPEASGRPAPNRSRNNRPDLSVASLTDGITGEFIILARTFIAASLALPLIAGCTTASPRVLSANDYSIALRVKDDNQSAARKEASNYCDDRNRDARLRSVTPTGDNRTVLTFGCV